MTLSDSSYKTIRTLIIDDSLNCIEELAEHLQFIPCIQLCGTATRYKQAKELIEQTKPDLVFLDVEMPGKNGFDFLKEQRQLEYNFCVVFYTVYDKYLIRALRESAFDFILKPVKPEELKEIVQRFAERRISGSEKACIASSGNIISPLSGDSIAIPTPTGLRFIDKNQILLFRNSNKPYFGKYGWECQLTDMSAIKMAGNISAKKILTKLNDDRYFPINQSCILNLNFLCSIEYKSRQCKLLPPFDQIELVVSRAQFSKLREVFELF